MGLSETYFINLVQLTAAACPWVEVPWRVVLWPSGWYGNGRCVTAMGTVQCTRRAVPCGWGDVGAKRTGCRRLQPPGKVQTQLWLVARSCGQQHVPNGKYSDLVGG